MLNLLVLLTVLRLHKRIFLYFKYLRVKIHDVCNLPSNSSEKKLYMHIKQMMKPMKKNVNSRRLWVEGIYGYSLYCASLLKLLFV